MRIGEISIHNFRSIKYLKFVAQDLMIFLGPNNHGKSNILGALEFGLMPSAKVSLPDFFAFRKAGDDVLWIELLFRELTKQEKKTFQKYIRPDGSLLVRKEAFIKNGSIDIMYRGYFTEPTYWWLKASAFDRLSTKDKIESEAREVPELAELMKKAGRITKNDIFEFQYAYIKEHYEELTFEEMLEDGPFMGPKNIAGGLLPDFYIVPAVRDLNDEMKVKSSTTFGLLLQRAVREMTKSDRRFSGLKDQLEHLIGELNERPDVPIEEKSHLAQLESNIMDELTEWDVDISIRVTPPEIEKVFELGTELWLDDGWRTIPEFKGHGLQRAIIFALIRAWAKALRSVDGDSDTFPRKASESLIFAFEEPELFLHPHAQRLLAKSIQDIASTPEHQVFVCSHSTHFIDLNRYKSIAIINKHDKNEGTRLRQCKEDLFEDPSLHDQKNRFHMAAWINPDRGEMFFARKAVFVEGETEKTILPYLAEKMGCLDRQVSVIDCGSKFNLQLYIKVANAFGLKYLVIHDEDPLPNPIPSNWKKEKLEERRRLYNENAAIANSIDHQYGEVKKIEGDFEAASGISKNQADKKGKALAALQFFGDKTMEEIPEGISEIVRAAYGRVAHPL